MKTAIISLTKNGGITAVKVKEAIGGDLFNRVPPEPYMTTVLRRPLSVLMPEIFDKYDRFVLIMAVGIAVRVVAPLIKTKDVDIARCNCHWVRNYCILSSGREDHCEGASDRGSVVWSDIP